MKIISDWNRIVFTHEMTDALEIILLTTPAVHSCILKAFLRVRGGKRTFAEPVKHKKSSVKGDTGWRKCRELQVHRHSGPLGPAMWKAQQSLPWRYEYCQGGAGGANRCAFFFDLGLKLRLSSLG